MDPQQVVNALCLGSIYALFASGYTLQFGVLHILNYAHGPMYMLAAVGAYLVLSAGGGVLLAIALPVLLVPIAGVLVERIAVRPLRRRGAGTLSIFVATIGAGIAITLTVQIAMGAQFRQLSATQLPHHSWVVGPIRISAAQVGILAASVFVYGLFYVILKRTRQGRAMRAVAENPAHAERLGVSSDLIYVLVFGVTTMAAALVRAGAAGHGRLPYLDRLLGNSAGWSREHRWSCRGISACRLLRGRR
jgi:branched-chain amino acid transport system permease protein